MKIVRSKEQIAQYLGDDLKEVIFEVFDMVRIVDPLTKIVDGIVEPADQLAGVVGAESAEPCYTFWKRDQVCTNCTSFRALTSQKPITKLETAGLKAYLIHSIPLTLPDGHKVVLEVFKNITHARIENFNSSAYSLDGNPEFSSLLRVIDQMNAQVYKDSLTGVYNREYLMTEIVSALLQRVPVTLLVIDIDDFKSINDVYGHGVGDKVLKHFAQTTEGVLREKEPFVRFGGDEFLIILPNTNEEQAEYVMQRIHQALKANPFRAGESIIPYEVSIGSFSFRDAERDIEEIIDKSDQAMYKAKAQKKVRRAKSS